MTTTPDWDTGLAALLLFVRAKGTADVPVRAIAAGIPVGEWVAAQRSEFWADRLDRERIRTLEHLPGWDWGADRTHRWDAGFAAVRRFVDLHGHARPGQRAVLNGFPVGMWVHNRRAEHRRGRLHPARGRCLESLAGWSWALAGTEWERNFATLLRFHAATGCAGPRFGTVFDGFAIGRWVRDQRAQHRAGRLTPRRVAQLSAVPGWVWSAAEHPTTTPGRSRCGCDRAVGTGVAGDQPKRPEM